MQPKSAFTNVKTRIAGQTTPRMIMFLWAVSWLTCGFTGLIQVWLRGKSTLQITLAPSRGWTRRWASCRRRCSVCPSSRRRSWPWGSSSSKPGSSLLRLLLHTGITSWQMLVFLLEKIISCQRWHGLVAVLFPLQAAPGVAQQQRDRSGVRPRLRWVFVSHPFLLWLSPRSQSFPGWHQAATGLLPCQDSSDSATERSEGHTLQPDAQHPLLSGQPAQTEAVQLQPNPALLICLPEPRWGAGGCQEEPRGQGRQRKY